MSDYRNYGCQGRVVPPVMGLQACPSGPAHRGQSLSYRNYGCQGWLVPQSWACRLALTPYLVKTHIGGSTPKFLLWVKIATGIFFVRLDTAVTLEPVSGCDDPW